MGKPPAKERRCPDPGKAKRTWTMEIGRQVEGYALSTLDDLNHFSQEAACDVLKREHVL